MSRIRRKGLKPFECEYLNENSIFVNYGTVICPAINSNENTFIPKGSNKKPLNRLLDPNSNEAFPTNNIVEINGAQKGCVCLKIIFKDVNEYITENIDEWEQSLFQKKSQLGQEYLKKSATSDFLNNITSDPELLNIILEDSSLGISEIVRVPTFETVDPKSENASSKVKQLKKSLEEERKIYTNWNEESSSYYVNIKKDDPYGISKEYVSQPKNWIYSTNIMPLVNFSLPISDVQLEFHAFEINKEEEERLDKYNFIIDSSKLVPIAYLDTSETIVIDQIIDFDYICSFPFYFNSNLSTKFI